MDWCLYGDDKRKEMDRDLKPEYQGQWNGLPML